ncbi:dynamin family protein [Psychrobacter sp. TAE2020]|uniref:dynamin family protein n=1 Tax=Psychrobacter sp. TAE2020 TaxID=2846762 RepID=UPI001C104817|nr:dynamin family protein [Psychrobacter sp. TAE2020]MBU5618069.1 dynamin family protein [Psychrobacter sp. TAE2020]
MFATQQILQENWNQLITIFESYSTADSIEVYRGSIDDFVMRLPLVGVFSAGKSSLMNALVGEKLLSIEITPETALATEFFYTDGQEKFIGHKANGETVILSKEELRTQNLDAFIAADEQGRQGWISAYVNEERLAKFPHVSLVDLPGLDSNFSSHNLVIDNYIDKSLAYAIVVSIEDGDIRESTQQFLRELKINDTQVILIISKADLKHEDDVAAVSKKIEQSITALLGKAPLKTVTISSRKKQNLDELIAAFVSLEAQSEARFNQLVTSQIIAKTAFVNKSLTKLLSTDDINIEMLEAEKQMLNEQIEAFELKIKSDTERLEEQSQSITKNISDDLKGRLTAQLDTLSGKLLRQEEISTLILNTARLAISEGLQKELAPLVKTYLKNIETQMPESIQIDMPELNMDAMSSDDFNFSDVASALGPILFLLKFNPIIATISTIVVPVLAKVIDMFRNESKKKAQQEAQNEAARSAVLNQVIPSVMYDVEKSLTSIVADNITNAQIKIQELIGSRTQQVQAQIEQKEQDILASKEVQAQRHAQYLEDQQYVESLLTQLTTAI